MSDSGPGFGPLFGRPTHWRHAQGTWGWCWCVYACVHQARVRKKENWIRKGKTWSGKIERGKRAVACKRVKARLRIFVRTCAPVNFYRIMSTNTRSHTNTQGYTSPVQLQILDIRHQECKRETEVETGMGSGTTGTGPWETQWKFPVSCQMVPRLECQRYIKIWTLYILWSSKISC